jgi:hypothetical protein
MPALIPVTYGQNIWWWGVTILRGL